MRGFSKFLIFFGIICLSLAGFLYWRRVTPKRLQFDEVPKVLSGNQLSGVIEPKLLVIKDLGIKLDIYPAEIKNARWEATAKGASYLTSTPIPGEVGNSVVYGHNWKSILGNLTKARSGQIIEITYSDGSTKDFRITFTQIVTPDQTQILNATKDRRITLYTCTGFLDTKRFVVTAFSLEDQETPI
ncbi:hypothetical protein A2955_01135 [Candidatus Woesebacteria bacterium RIFCSPLOWO2_01_FULL_37_19]|uniref:Sortase n=1 Tax=Candidatus Woesebacteria bacterium RIFCSPLOWO2_01_FULL_37_19 TaxID=1802514 RepID=A0A1F8B2M8_9BACT|nr:MAG: hypothetical protein A2955_01135 [Candidatus Woesebacteria bacterium RIFCSPLOWO2_01_FULL_37_19]